MNPEISDAERASIAQRGYFDPVFFCQFFFPELFSGPVPWVHWGVWAILERRCGFLQNHPQLQKIIDNFVFHDKEGTARRVFSIVDGKVEMNLGRYTLIMLPRGFSKTTLAVIKCLRNILYQECRFSLYVSNSSPHAKMQLATIKREISDNRFIHTIFGELRPPLREDQKWSEDLFETITGFAMAARGKGSQIRGLNHMGNRPKHIVADDMEDLESVQSDTQREKDRIWFYSDLIPALPEMDPDSSITVLGTLLHSDSLAMTLAQDPQWTTIKFGAEDADGELLWPENLDRVKLDSKKRSYARAGQLRAFYMEYYNKVTAEDTQIFQQRFFIYEPPPPDLNLTAIYCDPAISPNRRADETVIKVGGITKTGMIWRLDSWAKRGAIPRELIDAFFELSIKWRCLQHGIESIAYQAALIHLIREEMFRKKHYFEITAVANKTKKIERIKGILQPRYAAGYIRSNVRDPDLEAQLLEFPDSAHDDHADAWAGCVSLLDPYAGQALGLVEDDEDEDDNENWRWA